MKISTAESVVMQALWRRAPLAAALRIEEVRDQGPHGHISELAKHSSPLARWQVRTTLNGQGETR